jgi:hypothetical protein
MIHHERLLPFAQPAPEIFQDPEGEQRRGANQATRWMCRSFRSRPSR